MFDSVISGGTVARRRFGTGAFISVILHAGLLAFAIWISTKPAASKKQDLAVTFFKAPPPPPPPPPPPKKSPKPTPIERKPVQRKPDTIIAPRELPKEKPAEAEPKEESDDEGVEGGVEGGVAGGVVGGVIGGVVGGQLGSQVLPFGEGMNRPQRVEGHDPVYTREALEAHVEGLMIVKCVITVQGKLENCRIIKPIAHMEKAVLDALATWRYTPVTFQGRPVAVDYVFNIRLVIPKR
jgi:protein TonB